MRPQRSAVAKFLKPNAPGSSWLEAPNTKVRNRALPTAEKRSRDHGINSA